MHLALHVRLRGGMIRPTSPIFFDYVTWYRFRQSLILGSKRPDVIAVHISYTQNMLPSYEQHHALGPCRRRRTRCSLSNLPGWCAQRRDGQPRAG
jgi:hypothetical protein